jgi:hypothetical protein
VRLLATFQLNAVLDLPEIFVTGRQRREIRVGKQSLVVELAQREESSARAHPGIVTAVQPLQALGEEFDVANAAAVQLDIQRNVARGAQLFGNPLACRQHAFHRLEIARRTVNVGPHFAQEFARQPDVARGVACLDQHLQFPVARAMLVIFDGGVERNRQVPLLAFRAQA